MANLYSRFEMITGRKREVLGEEPYSNAILSTKNAIQNFDGTEPVSPR